MRRPGSPTAVVLYLLGSAAGQTRALPIHPVPSAAAQAAAGPAALRALAERIHLLAGRDLQQAVLAIHLASAQATDQPAVQYLLQREAIALCERHGRAPEAQAALRELARHFTIDFAGEQRQQLLRLARDPERAPGAEVALLALAAARHELVGVNPQASEQVEEWLGIAMHVVARDLDRLAPYVRACGDDLLAWAALWRLVPADAYVQRLPALIARLDAGDDCRDVPIDWLAAVGCALQPGERTATFGDLTTERLDTLAATSLPAPLRQALRRQAQAAAVRNYLTAPSATAAALARGIAERTRSLATVAGVTALRFVEPKDLEQLVIGNGDWRIVDGQLHGACRGTENFATHRLAFGTVRSVVVHGGIRSADGQNFRCKIGDVNLLLNWEVRDENHLWNRGTCVVTAPPALQVGKAHTLLLFQDGPRVHVCIDDQHWWTTTGSLAGTITVYPALGSEIFVREILIDGEPTAVVGGPSGELK